MLNFLAIVLIIFIIFLLLIFKKRKFKNLVSIKNVSLNRPLNSNKNEIKYTPKKNRFSYTNKSTRYSKFHKKALRDKMIKLFQGNTEDKLKALKIAKELADKSTLPILRKGLKDFSSEVIALSALLIRNFK